MFYSAYYLQIKVLTPSKLYLEYGYLQMKPFYRQTWFMVALAAASLVVLIMVIAILCVKSKSYKYKRKFIKNSILTLLQLVQTKALKNT